MPNLNGLLENGVTYSNYVLTNKKTALIHCSTYSVPTLKSHNLSNALQYCAFYSTNCLPLPLGSTIFCRELLCSSAPEDVVSPNRINKLVSI